MSKHDVAVTLRQMIDFADEIAVLISKHARNELDPNNEFRRALERCVELIGEATTRLPEEWRDRHSEIPWRQIIGMRDVMIHGYDVVSNDVIWDTAARDIRVLRASLASLLQGET